MAEFPLPGSAPAVVAIPAPGPGRGTWAGAPAARLDDDGTFLLAYRLRDPERRGHLTVVARSEDGERFETVVEVDARRLGADSVERPALVRAGDGRWRLYVCCATPGSRHWWTGEIEAATLERLAEAEARRTFPGDETVGVKDPVVRRRDDGGWDAWLCCHLLDVADEEDRMESAYATSDDGREWTWHGTVLRGRPGKWDARGARVTTVLPDGRLAYDGRATKEENWFERTGIGRWDARARQVVVDDDEPAADARYLDVVPLPGGGYRIFYEARLPDESHELRTELVPG
jgi:hypothetical protein